MPDTVELHAQRGIDRHADPRWVDAVTRELLASLHISAEQAGMRLVGTDVTLHVTPGCGQRVLIHATAPAEPDPGEEPCSWQWDARLHRSRCTVHGQYRPCREARPHD